VVSVKLQPIYPSKYDIQYLFGRKLNKPIVGLDMVEEKFSFGLARNRTPAIYLEVVNFND
jgi:hypothetical protein